MFYKAKIHIKVTGMKSLYTTQHRISKKKFDEFIRGVLSPAALTDLAKKVKFVQRSRKFLTPTFVAALFRSRADKEWTLSSIYRDYNALMIRQGKESMSWEPFHDFLARSQFKDFIRGIAQPISALSLELCAGRTKELIAVLKEKLNIRDVIIQDGCVVPIENNGLRKVFKGLRGSAAKIHMSLSLLHLAPINSVVTSGTASETANLPLELAFAVLFLCDAGYEDQKLFHAIDENKGFFIIKVNADCMYKVLWQCEINHDGTVSRAVEPTDDDCNPIGVSSKCNKDKRCRDIIAVTSNGQKIRIARIYNPSTQSYVNFATNIPPEVMDIFQIAELYRARWQVERFFRCYKGFSALSGCRSGYTHIQEAMILVSQLCADLKHIIAVMLETESGCVISHEKMAHSGNTYIQYLIESLLLGLTGARHFYKVVMSAAESLKGSATGYINRLKGKSLACIAAVIKRERFVSAIGYLWERVVGEWKEPIAKTP